MMHLRRPKTILGVHLGIIPFLEYGRDIPLVLMWDFFDVSPLTSEQKR